MKKFLLFIMGFLTCIILIILVYVFFISKNITMSTEGQNDINYKDTNNTKNVSITPINPENFSRLKDTFSSITVVNFWASWCIPCRKEIPLLKKYCSDNGYNLILISADRNNDKQLELVKKSMSNLGINFSYIIENSSLTDLQNKDAMKSFTKSVGLNKYIGGIPYIAVFDKKGQLIQSFLGFDEHTAFNEYMVKHIQNVKNN